MTGMNPACDVQHLCRLAGLSRAFCYLAVILDAFSRKVVGWALEPGLDVSLAMAALGRALARRLRPQDWKSGDKREVVEIVAPFGGAEEMVKDLCERVFEKT